MAITRLLLRFQARLWQIGKVLPPDLALHLESNAVLPVLYASSWLLTAFSADFPLFWSSRVMDVVLTDCYIEPMMKVGSGHVSKNTLSTSCPVQQTKTSKVRKLGSANVFEDRQRSLLCTKL